jgi:hypothetical protein
MKGMAAPLDREVSSGQRRTQILFDPSLNVNAVVVGLLVFASIVLSVSNPAPASPVKIIIDTDISSDVDDCGALAVANTLADQGEAEIVACVVNGHDADKASVAAVNAINTYYGRGKVPIGAYHGTHGFASHSAYTAKLRDEFPHTALTDDKAPEALSVYRRALADAPDGSVVIVSIGFLMNLRDLLDSKPDAASSLPGPELIRKKVRRLVVMGGQFPNPKDYAEYNFAANGAGPDTRYVVDKWSTPILFDGFSIGHGISTGTSLAETPAANPLRRAYQLYDHALKKGRSSWDPTAVLAAVRDPAQYWNIVSDGCCTVSDKGVSSWSQTPDRQHSYLAPKVSNADMARLLDSLIANPPSQKKIR